MGMGASSNLPLFLIFSTILFSGIFAVQPFAYADDDDDENGDDDDHDDVICANTILGGEIDGNVRVPLVPGVNWNVLLLAGM